MLRRSLLLGNDPVSQFQVSRSLGTSTGLFCMLSRSLLLANDSVSLFQVSR